MFPNGVGSTGSVTSLDLTWPTGLAAGDWGLLVLVTGGLSTITNPGGWTTHDTDDESTTLRSRVWTRICDGTETGTLTVSWTESLNAALGWIFYRGANTGGTVVNQANVVSATSSSATRTTTSLNAVNATIKDIQIIVDTQSVGLQSWSTSGITERVDVSSTTTPHISMLISDRDCNPGTTPTGNTATGTRTGTAYIGWHLVLNQAPATVYTSPNAATLDSPNRSFAAATPSSVTAATPFEPAGPSTGQIWPRGAV